MKLEQALVDQAFQQLVWSLIGWLAGRLGRTLRRRYGSPRGTRRVRRSAVRPEAAAEGRPRLRNRKGRCRLGAAVLDRITAAAAQCLADS